MDTESSSKLVKRIEWIDQLRGMAVILVILHHAGLRGFGRFILAFHMPLFFFISGLLFDLTKAEQKSSEVYIVKDAYRLMVPYVIYVTFYWIVEYVLIPTIWGGVISIDEIFGSILHDVIYLNRYYFISCLFIGSIIYFLFRKIIYLRKAKSKYFILALMFLSILIAWFIDEYTLPFQLEKVPVVIAFLCLGSLSFEICKSIYSELFGLGKTLILFILSMIGLIGFTFANYFFEDGANFMLYISEYGNYFFAYPAAFSGIFMMVAFNKIWCEQIESKTCKKVVSILSKYSILVYPVHLWGVNFGKHLAQVYGYHWIMAFIINLILGSICIIIAILVAIRWPILNGEKRKIIM